MAAESSTQSQADSKMATTVMIATIGVGVMVMCLLGFVIARSISKVLRNLIGEATRLSAGGGRRQAADPR